MKIFLATDHAGFDVKEKVKAYLVERGHEVQDMGALAFNKDDDYPDYISRAAKAVAEDVSARAVVFGWSGQGEAMVANRFRGVRAAVYTGGGDEVVTLSREHNDANVLSIGAHFVESAEACRLVELWLVTPFSEEVRHVRRIKKIDELAA